MQKSKLTI